MANLTNINGYFNVSTVGTVNVPSGSFYVTKTSGDAIAGIISSGGSGKPYYLRSNTNGSFAIYDDTACVERLTISSGGDVTFAHDVNITQTTDVGVLNTTNLDSGAAVGLSLTYPTTNVAAGDGLAIAIGIAGRGRSYIANSNVTTNLDASNLAFYTENGGVIGERMQIDSLGTIIGIGTYTAGNSIKIFEAERNGGAVAGDWSYDDATTDMSLGTSTAHSFSLKTGNTRALTIDSSGNSTFYGGVNITGTNNTTSTLTLTNTAPTPDNSWSLVPQYNSQDLQLLEDSTTRVTFESGGNVGIGTTSPDRKLHVSSADNQLARFESTDAYGGIEICDNTSGTAKPLISALGNDFIFYNGGSSNTEAMRIASGKVFIGKTVESFSTAGWSFAADGSNVFADGVAAISMNRGGADGNIIQFFKSDTLVGKIICNAASVTYSTTSDYRLKEDLKDFAGLDMVSKIPVYDFKWKTNEIRSYGVVAHELQEILPEAVSGIKDEEEMQGVDYGRITPILIKAIQELKAEIETLKTQINK